MKLNKLRNMILHTFKWFAYILGGVLFLAFLGLQVYKVYLKNSTKIESPNGISSLEKVVIGGNDQWLLIRGIDQSNPVLIFLHGGPGEPALGMASSRLLDSELIKHFTVVHWDQLGAGKSYNSKITTKSMTMDRWIEDCNELIDYLRNKFNTQKVFLVGHSGGTILELKTAQKYPEKIHAYVGVSQIVNNYEQQRISYNFIVEEAEKSGNVKIQHAIKTIGPPPYDTPKKEFEKAKYIVQYGGFIHSNFIKGLGFVVLSYLASPEYSFIEGVRTISGKGLKYTMNERYEELKNIDFAKEVKSLKLPVYFFQGKYDMITPTVQIEEFYDNLNAEKGKSFIMFENSAHIPIAEEKNKYQDLLIHVVLGDCRNQ